MTDQVIIEFADGSIRGHKQLPAPKLVDLNNLVCREDIAMRLGITRQAVNVWVKRHDSFPKPKRMFGSVAVYSWQEIVAWLDVTGRVKLHAIARIHRPHPPQNGVTVDKRP